MSIKISSAKAKGRRLQNWAAEKISKLLNMPWGKDEMIAPREMGQSGTDVRLIGPARDLFPFSIECKSQEKWSIPSWIKQAQTNELKDTYWLLVCKKNFCDPVILMDAEKFFELYGKILEKDRNKNERD